MTEREVNLKYRIVCETTSFIPLLQDPVGSLYFQREWLGSLSCRQMGTKNRQNLRGCSFTAPSNVGFSKELHISANIQLKNGGHF